MKEIYKAPTIIFGTNFNFLVNRKVLLKKALHVEKRDNFTTEKETHQKLLSLRSLDKAYHFFQHGHVQNVRFHKSANVRANVLSSLKKGKMYCA